MAQICSSNVLRLVDWLPDPKAVTSLEIDSGGKEQRAAPSHDGPRPTLPLFLPPCTLLIPCTADSVHACSADKKDGIAPDVIKKARSPAHGHTQCTAAPCICLSSSRCALLILPVHCCVCGAGTAAAEQPDQA